MSPVERDGESRADGKFTNIVEGVQFGTHAGESPKRAAEAEVVGLASEKADRARRRLGLPTVNPGPEVSLRDPEPPPTAESEPASVSHLPTQAERNQAKFSDAMEARGPWERLKFMIKLGRDIRRRNKQEKRP
jgi:hypothetical protein